MADRYAAGKPTSDCFQQKQPKFSGHSAVMMMFDPSCRFMAYDKHMNLVLGDSEEFRKLPPKKGRSEDEVNELQLTTYLID